MYVPNLDRFVEGARNNLARTVMSPVDTVYLCAVRLNARHGDGAFLHVRLNNVEEWDKDDISHPSVPNKNFVFV